MGKYINKTDKGALGTSFQSKCVGLIEAGAVEIPTPTKFVPNLVCVVNNGPFAAAAYCYNDREFDAFNYPGDNRPRRWFIWDKVLQFAD